MGARVVNALINKIDGVDTIDDDITAAMDEDGPLESDPNGFANSLMAAVGAVEGEADTDAGIADEGGDDAIEDGAEGG